MRSGIQPSMALSIDDARARSPQPSSVLLVCDTGIHESGPQITIFPSFTAGAVASMDMLGSGSRIKEVPLQQLSISLFAGSRITLRICSPIRVPPGSLERITS